MNQKQKMHASPIGSPHNEEDEAVSNPLGSSSDEKPFRMVRR